MVFIMPTESKTEYVKCYDRYENEIIGQECIKKIEGMNINDKLVLMFLGSAVLIIYCLLLDIYFTRQNESWGYYENR